MNRNESSDDETTNGNGDHHNDRKRCGTAMTGAASTIKAKKTARNMVTPFGLVAKILLEGHVVTVDGSDAPMTSVGAPTKITWT